jgi:uncharacterized repeat protein (TIGR03803 family)
VLHSFTGGADGGYPLAGLIRDSAGNLYGTTQSAGISGAGVVFKLDTTGAETVLYGFTGGADGAYPVAGLLRDSAGNLYGTASGGGASGQGVVFQVDTTGTETVLYNFHRRHGRGRPPGWSEPGLGRQSLWHYLLRRQPPNFFGRRSSLHAQTLTARKTCGRLVVARVAGIWDSAFPTVPADPVRSIKDGVPRGIRTPVTAVKGRCPRPG